MKDYEDYVDERAYKFFNQSYSSGGWGPSFNTQHEDLRPTTVFGSRSGRPVCAYCGKPAMPIQKNIKYGDYDTTGHTCVCKAVMDDREIDDKVAEIKADAEKKIAALRLDYAKPSKEVIKWVMMAQMKNTEEVMAKELNKKGGLHYWDVESLLDRVGLKMITGDSDE